jgi:hypothetical protein
MLAQPPCLHFSPPQLIMAPQVHAPRLMAPGVVPASPSVGEKRGMQCNLCPRDASLISTRQPTFLCQTTANKSHYSQVKNFPRHLHLSPLPLACVCRCRCASLPFAFAAFRPVRRSLWWVWPTDCEPTPPLPSSLPLQLLLLLPLLNLDSPPPPVSAAMLPSSRSRCRSTPLSPVLFLPSVLGFLFDSAGFIFSF